MDSKYRIPHEIRCSKQHLWNVFLVRLQRKGVRMDVLLIALFQVAIMIIFPGKYSILPDPVNRDTVVSLQGGMEG